MKRFQRVKQFQGKKRLQRTKCFQPSTGCRGGGGGVRGSRSCKWLRNYRSLRRFEEVEEDKRMHSINRLQRPKMFQSVKSVQRMSFTRDWKKSSFSTLQKHYSDFAHSATIWPFFGLSCYLVCVLWALPDKPLWHFFIHVPQDQGSFLDTEKA